MEDHLYGWQRGKRAVTLQPLERDCLGESGKADEDLEIKRAVKRFEITQRRTIRKPTCRTSGKMEGTRTVTEDGTIHRDSGLGLQ